MTLTALLAVAVSPYMSQAMYPARSPEPDAGAAGGFAEAANLPVPISGAKPNQLVSLTIDASGANVRLANLADPEIWFRATDGNLTMVLQAKIDGKWRGIQYHQWAWCGNSYHSVKLPPGYELRYNVPLPKGDFETEVRVAAMLAKPVSSKIADSVSTSAPVKFKIDRRVFELEPKAAKTLKLDGDEFPILRPVDIR